MNIDNEIQTFVSQEFGPIRAFVQDQTTWFVAKDIATALGYIKPENAVKNHVEDADKTTTLIQGSGSNYKTTAVIINESGLYSLILSSKLPSAKQFKRWVTHDVLPQLRSTGAYFVPGREAETVEKIFPHYSDETKLAMIRDLEKRNQSLIQHAKELGIANKALAKGILEWSDRAQLNSAVRKLAGFCHQYAGTIWNELYHELYYKHHMMLRARGRRGENGQSPLIQYIKEEEWPKVIQSFAALCEIKGTNVAEMIKSA